MPHKLTPYGHKRKEPSYLTIHRQSTPTQKPKKKCVSTVTTRPTIDNAQPGNSLETDKGHLYKPKKLVNLATNLLASSDHTSIHRKWWPDTVEMGKMARLLKP